MHSTTMARLTAQAAARGSRHGLRWIVECAGSLMAAALLVAIMISTMAEQNAVDAERAAAAAGARQQLLDTTTPETWVAGYFGAPYTYPSDIHIKNAAENTDVTVQHAGWDGKPFKSPIYYGVRVTRWQPGNTRGWMVDFTHSKTITRPDEEVQLKGLIGGKDASGSARIGQLFKHMEFSHGHNMLTLNALYRFARLGPRLSLYAGLGGGVALPHTEIQLADEPARTYEYQYAGLVGQALAGVEINLPGNRVFLEYKFSLADMHVPLSRLETGWGVTDIWRQFGLWWRGQTPPGGTLDTRLLSHQVIGGAAVRLTGTP